MSKQTSVMLAHKFNEKKHIPDGYLMSEKIDGMRCFWDGGVTRGMDLNDIPWAQINPKWTVPLPVSTGLWSRYCRPIIAPEYFLDKLPEDICLDGELYYPGSFQGTMSIVKRREPTHPDWNKIIYGAFDRPSPAVLFSNRIFTYQQGPNKFAISFKDAYKFVRDCGLKDYPSLPFAETYILLQKEYEHTIPQQVCNGTGDLMEFFEDVVKAEGEGVILRDPKSYWVPNRSYQLLKVKQLHDSEAIVIGYRWAKDGTWEGGMGSVIVSWREKTFELSGFNREERYLPGTWEPGEIVHPEINSSFFPRHSTIPFQYATLTKDGIPKEARYYRAHHQGR